MKTFRTDSPQTQNWQAIERFVASFETAYQTQGVADPSHFAPSPNDPLYMPTIQELVRVDLELAWERNEPKYLEDYRQSFPLLFSSPSFLSEVAFEEYRLRRSSGNRVSAKEYADRYQIDTSLWAEVTSDSDSVDDPPTELVNCVPLVSPTDPVEKPTTQETITFPKVAETFMGFQILKELGRGAFARVYLAEQAELASRLVALKVAHQLADESQTLARLQHTNIVPIHSIHQAGRFHAVCMPFFGSTTLSIVLREFRRKSERPVSGADFVSTINQHRSETLNPDGIPEPLPEGGTPNSTETLHSALLDSLKKRTHTEVVLWLGVQLASGLAHAHERGVLHRDLKPANILIADDGTPMLLDFNLSVFGKSSNNRRVGGTPYYMSPEQLRAIGEVLPEGEQTPVDERSDIYSLGLILYELLTGQLSKTPSDKPLHERIRLLSEERSSPFPSARRLNVMVSPAFAGIVAKCLEPLPENRYQSAQHLREDLERQLDHLPLKYLPEPSYRERLQKFVRRNPWTTSNLFLATVAMVILLTSGIVIQQVISQRDNARIAVAEGEFADTYSQLRISLTSIDRDRLGLAIQDAKTSLNQYGLPGGDGVAKPAILLSPDRVGTVREKLSDLYLLLALAEKQRNQADAIERSKEWLALARKYAGQPEREEVIDQFHRLLLNPKDKVTIPSDQDLEAILVFASREQPRELLQRLDQRPIHQLKAMHWVVKANAHVLLGDHPQAVSSYTTAMALNGQPNAELLVARGNSYLVAKLPEKALADFNAALTLLPENPVILINRALAYRDLDKKTEAIADLDHVIELWPTHTRSYFIRSELYTRLGRVELAKKDRNKGFSTETKDPVSLLARGVAYLGQGRPNEAIQDFDAVLLVEPKSQEARLNKSAALADGLGDLEGAIRLLGEIMDDYPNCTQAIAGRGVYRARLNKRVEAHADATLALKTDPSPFTRYQVAGIFALTSVKHPEDTKEALRLLASAFQDRMGLHFVENDPDLRGLQKNPQFLKLVEAAKELHRQQETKLQ